MPTRRLAWGLLLCGFSCSVYDASDLEGLGHGTGARPGTQGGAAGRAGGGSGGNGSLGGSGGTTIRTGGSAGQPVTGGNAPVAGRGGTSPVVEGGAGGTVSMEGGVGGVPASGTGGTVATGGSGGETPIPPEGGMGGEPIGGEGGAGGVPPVTGGAGGVEEPGGAGGAAGSGGVPACEPPSVGETCAHSAAPKITLLDFSTYDESDGTWGDSADGDLLGGTNLYAGNGADVLTLAIEGTGTAAVARLTGTLSMSSYAGVVFWFGPCVDASAVTGETGSTTGVTFRLGGSSTAALNLQVQTHETHPVIPSENKGGCLFTDCATRWSECVAPRFAVSSVPATATAVPVLWSALTPGAFPGDTTATTDGDGVLGLQFQFECQQASCSVNVTIGLIELTL